MKTKFQYGKGWIGKHAKRFTLLGMKCHEMMMIILKLIFLLFYFLGEGLLVIVLRELNNNENE